MCRIKTYDDKNLIFKTTTEAVTFQRALGKHSCSLGLLAGGPGGARLWADTLLWSQRVMLFLLLLLSLAWSAQSPAGAHQQPENFPGPAGDPWACNHRRSLTSELVLSGGEEWLSFKNRNKSSTHPGHTALVSCLNYFQLKRQCPQQLLTGRSFVLRRPCKLW